MSPRGRSKLDNFGLMTVLFTDLKVMEALSPSAGAHTSQRSTRVKAFYPSQAHRSYSLQQELQT